MYSTFASVPNASRYLSIISCLIIDPDDPLSNSTSIFDLTCSCSSSGLYTVANVTGVGSFGTSNGLNSDSLCLLIRLDIILSNLFENENLFKVFFILILLLPTFLAGRTRSGIDVDFGGCNQCSSLSSSLLSTFLISLLIVSFCCSCIFRICSIALSSFGVLSLPCFSYFSLRVQSLLL